MTPEELVGAVVYTALVCFWRVLGMPAIGTYLIYCVLMAIDSRQKRNKRNKK